MILIIEGPDGSGKTTLAEKLSKQTGFPVIHRSQPKTEEEKANMMKGYMETIKSGKNAIFDRCWYSEMAYGPPMLMTKAEAARHIIRGIERRKRIFIFDWRFRCIVALWRLIPRWLWERITIVKN